MSTALKVTRNLTRGYASVAAHGHAEGGAAFWKKMTFFVALPVIGLSGVNCYLRSKEEDHHFQPEFIEYQYRAVLNKSFPFGDGKHSAFHNPHRNPIRGIGYEQ